MTEKQINSLIKIAKEIELNQLVDSEVTIGGNGVNSSEAMLTLKPVFKLLKIDWPEISDSEWQKFLDENGLDSDDYER